MKRVNVMVSDESKEVLINFQKQKEYRTLDETVDSIILEYKRLTSTINI